MQADFSSHIKFPTFPVCRPAVLWFPGSIKAVFKTRAWDSNENRMDLESQPHLKGEWMHHFTTSHSCECQHTVVSQVGLRCSGVKQCPVPWTRGCSGWVLWVNLLIKCCCPFPFHLRLKCGEGMMLWCSVHSGVSYALCLKNLSGGCC